MLSSLKIENIAVIESADISFNIGLNVLTGETGAGKSIIIDSINAILGERTSKELVRTGTKSASVSALFEAISDETKEKLEELGYKCEEDSSLLLQRKISADGKNVCRINGETATVSILKELGKTLVDIHGQHDNRSLLLKDNHLSYIDKFALNENILSEYVSTYRDFVKLKKELKKLRNSEEENLKKAEMLRFQIDEIEKANIVPGEFSELIKKRDNLANAEKISSALSLSSIYLNGEDEEPGVLVRLKNVLQEVKSVASFDNLADVSKNLANAVYTIEDCAESIQKSLDTVEFNPNLLEETEERLDLISKLTKKYATDEDGLIKLLDSYKNDLNKIETSSETIEKLTEELDLSAQKMLTASQKLTSSREKASLQFTKRVAKELQFLDMPNVHFSVDIKQKPLGLTGADDLEFLISANLGETPKPLIKISSGGEMSRIMLAIKNVLSQQDSIDTMIFDEIDTGISGQAATKVAKKLYSVSMGKQVICVTHLSQIASFADSHFFISKENRAEHTFTSVKKLNSNDRKYELSRINGGSIITQSQLSASEELLKEAVIYKRSLDNGTKEN